MRRGCFFNRLKTNRSEAVKQIKNTGIIPDFTSTDDGYSSAPERSSCLKLGVKDVCFSGAKGKKILGDDLWNDTVKNIGIIDDNRDGSAKFILKIEI